MRKDFIDPVRVSNLTQRMPSRVFMVLVILTLCTCFREVSAQQQRINANFSVVGVCGAILDDDGEGSPDPNHIFVLRLVPNSDDNRPNKVEGCREQQDIGDNLTVLVCASVSGESSTDMINIDFALDLSNSNNLKLNLNYTSWEDDGNGCNLNNGVIARIDGVYSYNVNEFVENRRRQEQVSNEFPGKPHKYAIDFELDYNLVNPVVGQFLLSSPNLSSGVVPNAGYCRTETLYLAPDLGLLRNGYYKFEKYNGFSWEMVQEGTSPYLRIENIGEELDTRYRISLLRTEQEGVKYIGDNDEFYEFRTLRQEGLVVVEAFDPDDQLDREATAACTDTPNGSYTIWNLTGAYNGASFQFNVTDNNLEPMNAPSLAFGRAATAMDTTVLSGLRPGTYRLTIETESPIGALPTCFSERLITIPESRPPMYSAALEIDTLACGESTGSVRIQTTFGGTTNQPDTATIYFLRNLSTGDPPVIDTSGMDITFDLLPPGDYEVFTRNFLGCEGPSQTFTLNPTPGAASGDVSVVDLNPDQPYDVCNGGQTALSISLPDPDSDYGVRITRDGTGEVIFDEVVQVGTSPQELTNAGNYTAVFTRLESLCSLSVQSTIIENPEPLTASILSQANPPRCRPEDGSAVISVANYNDAYRLFVADRPPVVPTSAEHTITNLPEGITPVRIQDERGGCEFNLNITLGLDPGANFELDSVRISCQNATDGSITIIPTDGELEYQIFELGPDFNPEVTYENLGPNTYTVLARNVNNGCERQRSIALPQPEPILITEFGMDSILCADAPTLVRLAAVGPVVTQTGGRYPIGEFYQVSTDGGSTWDAIANHNPEVSGGTGRDIVWKMDLNSDDYTFQLRTARGCESNQLAVVESQFREPPPVTMSFSEVRPRNCYVQEPGELRVNVTGGVGDYVYTWEDGSTGTFRDELLTGFYSVTVTDGNECSLDSTYLLRTNNDGAGIGLPDDTIVCLGNLYVLDLSRYDALATSGPNGFTSNDRVVYMDDEGIYDFTVSEDTCTVTLPVQLNVSDQALAAGLLAPSDVVVNDTVVVAEISFPTPRRIEWMYDDPNIELLSENLNEYRFRFTEVGVYELGMTAFQNDCQDVTSATITVYPDSTSLERDPVEGLSIRNVTIMPNPNFGDFSVDIELSAPQTVTANLYDFRGNLIDRQRSENTAEVTFPYDLNLNPGTYIYKVETRVDNRTLLVVVTGGG